MSHTPLSDTVSALIASESAALVSAFEREFYTAQLGLQMIGLPSLPHGEAHQVTGGHTTIPIVRDGDGRSMVKACADPAAFASNHDAEINVLMTGRELLEMLMKIPDADGILVCSAASLHSIPIYRDEAEALLRSPPGENPPKSKPWWRFGR